jgi:hypothetical protein
MDYLADKGLTFYTYITFMEVVIILVINTTMASPHFITILCIMFYFHILPAHHN